MRPSVSIERDVPFERRKVQIQVHYSGTVFSPGRVTVKMNFPTHVCCLMLVEDEVGSYFCICDTMTMKHEAEGEGGGEEDEDMGAEGCADDEGNGTYNTSIRLMPRSSRDA